MAEDAETEAERGRQVDVSVVLPVLNGSRWLDEALHSLHSQTFSGSMELSVFNDGSTDSTMDILKKWQLRFMERNVRVVIGGHSGAPRGAGYGRNRAIEQSSGQFLCFLDADDIMAPRRVELQYTTALDNPNALIGSCFTRHPQGSTQRYTDWCNSLSHSQLHTQAFTAFGPTIIQPTWFCSRAVFDKTGPFSEAGQGDPEDLLFFYKHLSLNGRLLRVDEPLVVYRYHLDSATFSIDRLVIWKARVDALQDRVLCKWKEFTIWNAGKQGRRLFRSLRPENQAKVVAFCDVDANKISQGCYTYEESERVPKPTVPIVHYSVANPPFILCVKWGLTSGGFEDNLASLNLTEGQDYYNFS